MSRFILVAMTMVTVAACNRFPDNGLQIVANLPPDDSCVFDADPDIRLLRGRYDLSYRNPSTGAARDYVIAPLLQSYLVSAGLEFQGEQNNIQVDNYDITILLPDGSVPALPAGVVNPYRVDTSAVLPAIEQGGTASQEVAAALGIPASYQDALRAILPQFSSIILEIRAGGTTFGGFSQRSAPFRWPVDLCEGCLTVDACTIEQFEASCLPGQDVWLGCSSVIIPPPAVTP
jgi:hypothetical protein